MGELTNFWNKTTSELETMIDAAVAATGISFVEAYFEKSADRNKVLDLCMEGAAASPNPDKLAVLKDYITPDMTLEQRQKAMRELADCVLGVSTNHRANMFRDFLFGSGSSVPPNLPLGFVVMDGKLKAKVIRHIAASPDARKHPEDLMTTKVWTVLDSKYKLHASTVHARLENSVHEGITAAEIPAMQQVTKAENLLKAMKEQEMRERFSPVREAPRKPNYGDYR